MPTKILVAGLLNMETTVKIEKFPVEYSEILYPFYGVNSSASGVGLNVATALTTLGDDVSLLSLLGDDSTGLSVREALKKKSISDENVLLTLKATPESAVLFDDSGRRQVYCDLKDIQDSAFPTALFSKALKECEIACLCNINFARPMLNEAKKLGKLVASDVQVLSDINDDYNSDFMAASDILFVSSANMGESPESFVRRLVDKYHNKVIVVGLGSDGALLYNEADNFMGRFTACHTRTVVNTIGAGDALFSAFIHFYAQSHNPYESLKYAQIFASWKIGEAGGANGFIDEKALKNLVP